MIQFTRYHELKLEEYTSELPKVGLLLSFVGKKFFNQAHAHSRPKAGCGRAPGLLKLFS